MVAVLLVVIGMVLALVMDFREVMLMPPPELAHCGGGGTLVFQAGTAKNVSLS